MKKENESHKPVYRDVQLSVQRFSDVPLPIPFLIDNLIPKETVGAIYSPGGVGKSTLAYLLSAQVALSHSYKMKWLNEFPINSSGKVLYVSSEDPETVLHHRHYGIRKQLAESIMEKNETVQKLLEENLKVLNLSGKTQPLVVFDKGTVKTTQMYDHIKNTIDEVKPVLIIIDTKSKFSGLNENDNALVAQEINKYEALVKDRGANLILLHHTTKSATSYRGASSFLDSLRWGIQLKSLDRKQVEFSEIESGDISQYIVVENTKQNYGPIQASIIIRRIGAYWFEKTSLVLRTATEDVEARNVCKIRDYLLSVGNEGRSQSELQDELCKKQGLMSNHALQTAIRVGLTEDNGTLKNVGHANAMQIVVNRDESEAE